MFLRYLFGRSFSLPVVLLASMLFLSNCSNPVLSLLAGGGPNVAANTQLGQTNSQTVGTTEVTDQRIVRPQARDIKQTSDTNRVSADNVERIVVNEYPIWLILAFVVAVLMDSPVRWFKEIFSGRKK